MAAATSTNASSNASTIKHNVEIAEKFSKYLQLMDRHEDEAALALLHELAEMGHIISMIHLGDFYMKTDPPWRDDAKACELYARAAACGSKRAKRQLAHCYVEGIGCKRDLETGLAILRGLAEDHLDGVSYVYLAKYYADGTLKPDPDRARFYEILGRALVALNSL
jgi:TPR repeat protein